MSREKWFQKEIDELIKDIANATTELEVIKLFETVLTPREINDIARRLKILKMIKEGKSYLEIQDVLNVSSGVISRVSANVGFGFRRSNKTVEIPESNNIKVKKRIIKYKGATPIHRLWDS